MPVRRSDAAVSATEHALPSATRNSTPEGVDYSAWLDAPRERTASYFPVYSAVSRAMQAALRAWVREWFDANPEVLERFHAAYPVMIYMSTHPYYGRPTNVFTYDIQQDGMMKRAYASALNKLKAALEKLDTAHLSWDLRERYFAYRSREVVKYVSKNERLLCRMLNCETVLMNAVLKFALIDIEQMGMEKAIRTVRRAFETQLRRFSSEFDLSSRADELLAIATSALRGYQPAEAGEAVEQFAEAA